jgi:hypothetical protein
VSTTSDGAETNLQSQSLKKQPGKRLPTKSPNKGFGDIEPEAGLEEFHWIPGVQFLLQDKF